MDERELMKTLMEAIYRPGNMTEQAFTLTELLTAFGDVVVMVAAEYRDNHQPNRSIEWITAAGELYTLAQKLDKVI